jgi:hypothetical protein
LFFKNSETIDKQVRDYASAVNKQNANYQELKSKSTTEGVLDSDKLLSLYGKNVSQNFNKIYTSNKITNPNNENEFLDLSEFISEDGLFSEKYSNKGYYTVEDLKNIDLYKNVLMDSSSSSDLRFGKEKIILFAF